MRWSSVLGKHKQFIPALAGIGTIGCKTPTKFGSNRQNENETTNHIFSLTTNLFEYLYIIHSL